MKGYDEAIRQLIDNHTVLEFEGLGPSVEEFIENDFTKCTSDNLYPKSPCRFSFIINQVH